MTGSERIGLERTRGALRLAFAARNGRTALTESFQKGAFRVRFPRAVTGSPPEAVLINTAGGLTGGDRLDAAVSLGPDTRVVVTSQACEKIYRSSGGETRIRSAIDLARAAELDWLPQPTILFDQARLLRETQVDLAADSRLLLLEACVLGRTAMREVFQDGALSDHWRIRRNGRLIYADTVALRGDVPTRLGNRWGLGANRAYAALLYVAPDAEARLEQMRTLLRDAQSEGAASAWNGLLAVRLLAADGYSLLQSVSHIVREFRGEPLPRLWAI